MDIHNFRGTSIVLYTDLSDNELHRQLGNDRVVVAGGLDSMIAIHERTRGLSHGHALDTIHLIFTFPTTLEFSV